MTDSAPYIGARIRLISKNDIRYEGTLHSIDSGRSTVILSEVRSFGSEGRKPDGQQIQPSNEIFDFIEFPSHDIKQLTVCQLPPSVPQQNPTPTGQQQGQAGPNPQQQGPFGPMPGQFGMGMPYGPQGWNPYFNMYGPANPWSNQQGFGMNPLTGYPPLGMNPFQQGPGFGFPPGPMPGAPLNTPTPNNAPQATANPTPVTPAAQSTPNAAANTKPESTSAKPQEKTESKSTANTTAAQPSAASDKKSTANTTAAPAKTAQPSQPRPAQTAAAPQPSTAKGQPTVQRPRNPWENKHHPTVVAPPSTNTAASQGPAQGQQGQSRDRQQGQSRGQNGNYNQGRQQGGRGGHRGGRGGRQQYAVKAPTFTGDYDWEKSNEKFEHLLEELDIKEETAAVPEPAYDKTRSFFDTISCEASEKKEDESLDRRAKNKLLQDQKRLDTETFGAMQVDQVYRDHMQQNQHYHRGHQGHRGHRGNYRGGQGGDRQQRSYNQPQQRGYNSRGGRGGQSGQYKSRGGQNNAGSNFKPVQPSNAAKQ